MLQSTRRHPAGLGTEWPRGARALAGPREAASVRCRRGRHTLLQSVLVACVARASAESVACVFES